MNNRTCSECGILFIPRRSTSKFCSNDCFKKHRRQLIKKPCAFCSKTMIDIPKIIKKRKYCSNKCRYAANRIYTDIPCTFCGKEFIPSTNRTKYCSNSCRKQGRANPGKECQNCKKSFTDTSHPKRKYCSAACFKEYAKAKVAAYICKQCGIEFFGKPSAKRQFCSNRCKTIAQDLTGSNNPRWRGGYRNGYRGPNWKEQSSKARQRDNFTCRRCGHFQIKPHLPVHHIKPYRDFNGDYKKANRLSNLITLCRNCHSRLETRAIKGVKGFLYRYQWSKLT